MRKSFKRINPNNDSFYDEIRIETTSMANDEPADRVKRGIESSRDALLLYYLLQRPDDILPRFCLRLLSSLLFSNPTSTVTATTTITIPANFTYTMVIPKTVC